MFLETYDGVEIDLRVHCQASERSFGIMLGMCHVVVSIGCQGGYVGGNWTSLVFSPKEVTTLFRFIAVLRGTNNILWNIPIFVLNMECIRDIL